MAAIRKRKRKDGTTGWAVTWREDGRQTSRTFSTETDARMLADFLSANGNSFELAARAAARVRSTAPTVDYVVRRHVESLTAITSGTRAKYLRIYERHIMVPLGGVPVDALTRDDVVGWFNRIERAAKTKKNIHSLLSAALSSAVSDGLMEKNVAAGVRAARELPRKSAVFLTPEQVEMIAGAIRPEYALFVRLLAASGLRFGEAAALRWRDLDMRGERVVVHVTRAVRRTADGEAIGAPKTKSSVRTVSLPLGVREALREARGAAGVDDLIFQSPGGRTLSNGFFHRRVWIPCMDAIGARLGVRPRVHDLRHTHASRLIDAGVPLPVVQRRLGHESITTTVNTYGHLAVDADARAAAALD